MHRFGIFLPILGRIQIININEGTKKLQRIYRCLISTIFIVEGTRPEGFFVILLISVVASVSNILFSNLVLLQSATILI